MIHLVDPSREAYSLSILADRYAVEIVPLKSAESGTEAKFSRTRSALKPDRMPDTGHAMLFGGVEFPCTK